MNDTQLEQVGMFIKVKTFLNKKTSELAATPIVTSTIAPAFSTAIDKILEEDEDASSTISGNTEVKRELRRQVEEQGFGIAAACVAYYTITAPDARKRIKCEFERSELSSSRMRDIDLYKKIKIVFGIAEPVKALLTGFGVTAANVDALGVVLEEYFVEVEAPEDAIGERAASGRQVDRNIEAAKEILTEQLDVVMKYYVLNNPELHDYYLNARAIDGTGGGEVPDEDEELTIGAGQYEGGEVAAEINDESLIEITNRASNTSELHLGFNNIVGSFGAFNKTVAIGAKLTTKAIDIGFSNVNNKIVFYNPGNPDTPLAITVRVRVFY